MLLARQPSSASSDVSTSYAPTARNPSPNRAFRLLERHLSGINAMSDAENTSDSDVVAKGNVWPASHDEMRSLIDNFDWSPTPLGPMENWSPTLKIMIPFLLRNRFPRAPYRRPSGPCVSLGRCTIARRGLRDRNGNIQDARTRRALRPSLPRGARPQTSKAFRIGRP